MTYKKEYPVHDRTFVIIGRKRCTVEIVKESMPDKQNTGLSIRWRYIRKDKPVSSLSWSGSPEIYEKLIRVARDSLKDALIGALRAKRDFSSPQLVLSCCAGGGVSAAFRF